MQKAKEILGAAADAARKVLTERRAQEAGLVKQLSDLRHEITELESIARGFQKKPALPHGAIDAAISELLSESTDGLTSKELYDALKITLGANVCDKRYLYPVLRRGIVAKRYVVINRLHGARAYGVA